jgi:hypothetical protein
VKLLVSREGTRARLTTISPLLAAGATLGGCSFVAIFVAAFSGLESGSIPAMLAVWAVVLGVTAWVYVWRRRRDASGREDLVLHADGRHITLPENCGRKASVTIARQEIADAVVAEIQPAKPDSESSPSYAPAVVLRNGERMQLVKWSGRESADAFVDWLRGELQMAPARVHAEEAPKPG